jgi:CxxC motif-containing protein (DUF1111 family)
MRTRILTIVIPVTMLCVAAVRGEDLSRPMPELTAAEQMQFFAGREAFEAVEAPDEGLGPVFNDISCGACHSVGGTGGGSDRIETRFGAYSNRAFDPLAAHGGSLIQTDGIGVYATCNFVGEAVPPEATVVAGRRATPLFGLGLVDALADRTFLALAWRQRWQNPEIAGRPAIITDVATGRRAVGRFGWKNQVASLLTFSADAYLNEMGITTPLFPEESCPQGDCSLIEACDPIPGVDDELEDVELFRDFMAFLAPPPRARAAAPAFYGAKVFDDVGCAGCHVPALISGNSETAALSGKVFRPYSDFLLHDMGALGDGIEQGAARGSDMRTAPLWGLRLLTTYLHDGRAETLDEAIMAHDGQGRYARERYRRLSREGKERLLAFLRTL